MVWIGFLFASFCTCLFHLTLATTYYDVSLGNEEPNTTCSWMRMMWERNVQVQVWFIVQCLYFKLMEEAGGGGGTHL